MLSACGPALHIHVIGFGSRLRVLCDLQLTEESLLVAIPVSEDPVEEAFDNQENCAAAANSAAMAPRSGVVDSAGHAALPGRLLAGRVLTMQASELRGASSLALTLQVLVMDLYKMLCRAWVPCPASMTSSYVPTAWVFLYQFPLHLSDP